MADIWVSDTTDEANGTIAAAERKEVGAAAVTRSQYKALAKYSLTNPFQALIALSVLSLLIILLVVVIKRRRTIETRAVNYAKSVNDLTYLPAPRPSAVSGYQSEDVNEETLIAALSQDAEGHGDEMLEMGSVSSVKSASGAIREAVKEKGSEMDLSNTSK